MASQGRAAESNHHSTPAIINTDSSASQQGPHVQWPPPSQPPQVFYPPGVMPPNGQFTGYAPLPPGHYPHAQAQPPPAFYYGQGYAESPPRSGGFSWPCRCFLIFLIVIILFLVISRIIIWATLLPRFPIFHVDNMSVTNFDAEANPFRAKWDAKVTVENPNKKLDMYLDKVEGFVNYNDKYDVGFTWKNPMFLESRNKTTMRVVIVTGMSAHYAVPLWIVQDMGRDQKDGAVNFLLKFRVWATLKSRSWSWFRRSLVLYVECDDLNVVFRGGSKNGTLESKDREDCDIST
ncbi:hypothetical protein HRI_000778600 [Hibiscus trionum]|uniref:Late embryogenesis abundant protein LEA-2 subgroup domain-containing protein n=1 Tax=Hibiscus trionum TaxID=183268 RepID=A0A9W7H621_HIBTR|nr:hypothetical protein HRI_000778600 [Hibiscus trionum]